MQYRKFKIIIFGNGGVGKTTLVNRYLTGVYDGNLRFTIGVDFYIKMIKVDGIKITLQIWDFAGEDRFRFLLPSYANGAAGGIFMYDITRFTSLKNIDEWFSVFKNSFNENDIDIPIIMVGGKLDLEFARSVFRKDAIEIAKKQKIHNHIECSSKTGENVEEIFINLARSMMLKERLL
ncbi:MAG: Rab family GTPase [Promethearchaeota archaeon]